MSSIFDWSLTAASNGTADSSINWQEGQLPSTVNNSARQMMTRVAEFLKDFGGTVSSGGTANALTLTANSPFSAYATGQIVGFKATASNTGAATLNVNSIGAKAIRKNTPAFDTAISADDILEDGVYVLIYDETLNAAAGGWLLVNPSLAGLYTSAETPPRGYRYGLTLSNNTTDATNDIDIAAGEAASDATTPVLMTLASALTKRLDAAWAVGTNQGGLDTGSIANTTYHVWLIQRSDTGVVDVLFSASATSPTMPTNYDRKRRIGSIVRASAAILPFYQVGKFFFWTSRSLDLNITSLSTAGALIPLTVPTGINVLVRIAAALNEGAATRHILIGSYNSTNSVPSDTLHDLVTATTVAETVGNFERVTDTSGQILYRASASSVSGFFRVWTIGWEDINL